MVKREATPKVDKVDVVPQGWGNSLEVFEHALEHEKHISKLIDELVYLASEEKDNATGFSVEICPGTSRGRSRCTEYCKPVKESRR